MLKALICSYNYKCNKEMCNLIDISNSKFQGIADSIFNKPRKKKDKNNNKIAQEEFKAMKNGHQKMVMQYH